MKRPCLAGICLALIISFVGNALAQKVGSGFSAASTPFSGGEHLYIVQGGKPHNTTVSTLAGQIGPLLPPVPVQGVISPTTQMGCVGDGVHDDTACWQTLCALITNGVAVSAPPGKTYLVYTSSGTLPSGGIGQLCTPTGITGLTIYMNGSTFKVGHTFPPQQTVSGAASNGSGLIRLTVGSTVGMQTGDPSFVSQVGGTVEANGIWTITVIDATHIDLQGTTFTHAYTSGGLFVDDQAIWLFHTVNTSQVKVYDLAFTQTTPIAIPISGPQGTIGLLADTGGSNYLVVNSSCSGGQAPFGISGGGIATGASPRTHDVTVLNQTSTGCVYGFFAADNGDGVTVRGLYTDVVDRSYFVYGVKNHDVQLVSRNGEANDVLIKAAQAGNGDPLPTRNIKLQYEIRKRTDGLFPATYVDIDLSGGNPGYIGDIQLDISGDLSGENTATKPLVQIEKHTTGTLGATVENVKIGCTVTGIQNLSGILIDLFDAADAPWTGEFARNVMVEGCTGTGSATPTYHSDLAAFTNAGSGAREEWKSVNLPGTRSYDNPTVFNRWDTQVSLAGVFTSSSCNQIGGSDLPAAVQALQPINSTNYHGGAGYTASAAPSNGITLPRAGFFNTLFVTTDSNPAGTDTETLFGGAGAQPNTCNITTGNTQCSDMTHVSQEFSPGALIYERAVTANSGSPRGISWSGQFCSP